MYIPTKKFYSTNVLVKDYTTNNTRMPPNCYILAPFILSLRYCYLIPSHLMTARYLIKAVW